MGDFMPDAHVNGSLGCSFTALTCNNSSAIFKALSLSLIMGQKYKVFSDKSLIHINDSPKKNIPLLDVNKIQDFKAFKELTQNGEIQISSEQTKELFDRLFKGFHVIYAAGGLVTNANDSLLIKRLGFWDLPKGKLEKDEAIQVAAMREVREECGVIGDLTIVKELEPTYHVYEYESDSIIKKTYWFHMIVSSTEKLIPQLEEGITECRWIPKEELSSYSIKCFPLIRALLLDFYP